MDWDGYQTSRVFITEEEGVPPEKVHFPFLQQAKREISLGLRDEPSPEMLKKIHLSALLDRIGMPTVIAEEQIINRMSRDEIDDLLEQIDALKQVRNPDMKQKINDLLIENTQKIAEKAQRSV
jgi:hypothetical protein